MTEAGKPPSRKIRLVCDICGKTVVDPPNSLVEHKATVHNDPIAKEILKDVKYSPWFNK